ncbi:hypothetical protein QVD17_16900 [Tagetes erecta]|uniref:Pentatricopeptide repeat-containing protein n=1 Tax=Tagetes erecta TaxID=13708 RepID=A0AAD8NZU9_TARER|nr:hypothetical protein QVD17_16900 [Tagetes erecta]
MHGKSFVIPILALHTPANNELRSKDRFKPLHSIDMNYPSSITPSSSPLHLPFPFQFPLFFTPSKSTKHIFSATSNQTQYPKPNTHPTNKPLIPLQQHNPTTKIAQTLAEKIKYGKFETLTDFNHMFLTMVSADEIDLAYKFYSNLPNYNLSPNILTYSILVNCHCKRNKPMEAKHVLQHMISNGFGSPNVKTFTQVINSFCKKGNLTQAFQVFEMMGQVQCDPSINTYNCLLKGLCYVGRVEEANELLSRIKKSWKENAKDASFKKNQEMLKPDVYSFTAVMDGFCKVGRSDEALELLNEAIEMGLVPSIVSYNTIFNGYFKEGRPLEGFGLLEKMKERELNPDCVSYSTLLHGLLQWGEIRAGIRVHNEMVSLGFEVDERMMNTLLRGVCRKSRKEKDLLKDAYRLFDEMCKRGCDVDPCAFELMIEAFCNGNEMDKGFGKLCEMMSLGLCPRTFTLDVVVKGLCVEGKIEEAMWILVLVCRGRSEMFERVTFDVLINEMNRRDMVVNASCVYCVALKNGVTPLRNPRR